MKNEKLILYLLTFVWFCSIVDFLLLLPLGTSFMKLYVIHPREYSWLIAAYSLSGGISAFVAAFYVDKFDRKHVLMYAFALFGCGSILCSFAGTFYIMLFARMFTGLFGGLLGGVTIAIVSDMVPYARRGKAMGTLNLGFGLASIFGIPFAIFISKQLNVFAPFRIVGILSLILLLPVHFILPNFKKHINREVISMHEILAILRNRNIQNAFLFCFFLVVGHFMFISFINPYLIDNLGFREEDTMWMYIVGGISVSLTSPRIGKFVDTLGKLKSFRLLILLSFIPILVISHLQHATIMMALLICAFMFIFNSGRMIAAQTLITGAASEKERGKFLVIRSSIIELSEGCAAFIGGLILTQNSTTGKLENYNIIGYIAVVLGLLCIYLAQRIQIKSD
ncbi:MAG: arabinose efflux permease family protein [Bacteroidota bacterium]|nr:arabinose efflux permease family protein [Bacteroidota bacterium]